MQVTWKFNLLSSGDPESYKRRWNELFDKVAKGELILISSEVTDFDRIEIVTEEGLNNKPKEELEVYSNGIVHCSVCTNIRQRDRIENLVNIMNPTGTSNRWTISNEPTFSGGEPNPCPCENKPKTHKHYLMVC